MAMGRAARRLIRGIRKKYYGLTGTVPHPDIWLFVVGCYNSGTTLLSQLLARHPQIGSMSTEGQFYTDQLPVPQDLDLPRSWALEPERFHLLESDGAGIDVDRIKRQWQRAYNDSNRPILMEKSPTNAARIRWLNANFENSYFVAIVRNPYAAIEGMKRKSGLTVEQAARQWVQSNEIMLSDLEKVERSRLVTYEHLTERPLEVFAEIASFLGLEGVVDPYLSRPFIVHEREGEICNLNDFSFDQLSTDEIQCINAITHPLQSRLAYRAR